jgi:hypothetical protein
MIDPKTRLQTHTSLETQASFRLIPYWKRLKFDRLGKCLYTSRFSEKPPAAMGILRRGG